MAETLNATLKGEQRGGQEAYLIEIFTEGVTRNLDKTKDEVAAFVNREELEFNHLQILKKRAILDGQSTTTIDADIVTSTRLLQDARSVQQLMGWAL